MISGSGSDLSLLIANIVAGALVGYVTKALAINMLFKEYPIIGGAKIIKDRENLEVSMSTLVEEKLIKPSTMLEEFQKTEFKESFEKLINYIVQNTLKDNIKEIDSISHIDGVQNTTNNLYNFLISKRKEILEIGLEVLFDNVLIQDALSKDQINNIVDKLLTIILSIILNNHKDILDKFSNEFKNIKISDILNEKFIKNLITEFDLKHLYLLTTDTYKDNLNMYINELFKFIKFDDLILNLESIIKNKTLAEILIKDKSHDPSDYVIKNVQKLLTSDKGKLIFKDVLTNLINIFEELDIPLSSFLTNEIEVKLLQLIEKYLPDLLINVEEWIALNRIEMQNLINESIEGHLESENIVKQIIGNIFAQNLSERYKIVESTIEELKRMAKKAGPDVIKIANRFLDNTNISDIVKYAKNNFLDYDALTEIVIDIVLNYIEKIDPKIFNTIMNTKLSEFSFINNINLNKLIKDKLMNTLVDQLRQEIINLNNNENREKLNNFLFNKYKTLADKNLMHFIDYSDSLIPVIKEIIDFESLKPVINKKIAEVIPEVIKNKTINQVVTATIKNDIYNKLNDFYDISIKSALLKLSKEKTFNIYEKTSNIYIKLTQNKLFSKQITDTLINLMVNLIRDNKLLDGKIYIAVKESFSRFSDNELKDEMDSFMGKELQPIKLLGAFLGAIVGIIMYYLSFIPGYGQYVTGYAALISYPLAYAITEVGTNWMAIKMLFKPYHEKRILGLKLPFTPGVFPKNKKALADSMVNFIDKKLLSKDNMVKILERHQLKWKEVIKDVVSKNNYKVLDDTLNNYAKENYDSVSPIILDTAFDEINKNRDQITNYLIDEVKNIDLRTIDLENSKKEIYLKIDQTNILLKELSHNFINDIDNKSIITAIGQEKIQIITYQISKILFSEIEKKIKNKVEVFNIINQYTYILNNKLSDIISYEILYKNKESFINFVLGYISDNDIQDTAIEYFNNQILKSGLSSKKSLNDIFDGKLISLILKESGTIMKYASKYIHTLAINKKDYITDIIIHDVEKKGIVETMLVRFGGVRSDVRGIVDVLIDNKLENYLSEKETELHELFNSYVSKNLSTIKLFEFGISDDIFDKKNIKKLIKGILNSHQFSRMSETILSTTIEDIFKNMTLIEILEVFEFKNIKEIVNNFSDEYDYITNHLEVNINSNRQDIINTIDKMFFYTLDNTILKNKFSEIIKTKDYLFNNIDSLIDLIYKTDTINYSRNIITNQLILEVNNHLSEIIDYSILQRDLSNMIYNLTINGDLRSDKFKNHIKDSVKDITIHFVEVLNENVEKETKKVIEDILVNSLVDSMRVNNREIMEPIDFETIVRKEVEQMDPSRIEALFDFAKPIFRLLVWYGALGGIIGLAVGVFEAFR